MSIILMKCIPKKSDKRAEKELMIKMYNQAIAVYSYDTTEKQLNVILDCTKTDCEKKNE